MATVTYSFQEVRKHSGKDSCWIVIDGKVYDVTKYLDQHPGGGDEILNESGTDATEAFNEVGHSSDAREILETLKIGEIFPEELEALRIAASKNRSTPWSKSSAVVAVPLVVAFVAVFVFSKRK